MEDKIINIAIASDENYLHLTVVALKSLLSTNDDEFHIHLLANKISKQGLDILRKALKSNRCVLSIYPMEDMQKMLGIEVPQTISIVSYARLFLPSILPQSVDKVLYIDCDVLFNGGIREFYDTKLDNALVAGVHDLLLSQYYRKRIAIPMEEPYFNAGILLIPLHTWRKENLQQKFLDFLLAHNGVVFHHDQGIINAVCAGRKKAVLPKYNAISNYFFYPYKYMNRHTCGFYTQKEFDTAKESPAIIHFTGIIPGRPWEEGCTHPYKDVFMLVRNQTVFYNKPLSHKRLSFIDRMTIVIYHSLPFSCYAIFLRLVNILSYLKNKQ